MQHCEPEDLALVALGETPADIAVASHLEQCAQCQAEVESLSGIVAVGRSIKLDDQPMRPPASVWASIQSELAADAPAVSESTGNVPTAHGDQVIDLQDQRRKRRRWVPVAVAAASCLVLGGVVGGLVVGGASIGNGKDELPVTVASGLLEPVPGGPDPQTTGSARLERANGQYLLQVDARGLRNPDGFYEVWMMDPNTSGLVAIGTFNANQSEATFPVPSGLPLASYTSVDISDEPFDGVPGHSAVSVLRGNLAT
jgi:hypothetical protein